MQKLSCPPSLQTLALLRIAAALLSLALLSEGFLCSDWLGAQGPRHSPGLSMPPSVDFFYRASPDRVLALLVAGVVSSLALAAGLLTPLANLATWLVLLSLRNHLAWYTSEGALQVTHCTLLMLLLTPSGRCWSLDAGASWWRHWPRSAWPIRALQFLQVVIYSESGVYKWMGRLWWEGAALKLTLQNDNFSRVAGALNDPWPAWMKAAAAGANWMTMFWELTFGLWLLHRSTRRLALAYGVAMHLILWIFFDIGYYAPAMLMLYLTYGLPTQKPEAGSETRPASRGGHFNRAVALFSAWQVLAFSWAALPSARVYPEESEASPVPGLRALESTLFSVRARLAPWAGPLERYCQACGMLHRYNTFAPSPPRLVVFYRLSDDAGAVLWTDFPGQGRRYSWQVIAMRGTATMAPELLPILFSSFARRLSQPNLTLTLEEWAVDVGRPLSELTFNRKWSFRKGSASGAQP